MLENFIVLDSGFDYNWPAYDCDHESWVITVGHNNRYYLACPVCIEWVPMPLCWEAV